MSDRLHDYISEHDLAATLGRTVWALRRWRQRGYGPAWAKLGKGVFYKVEDVRRFLDDQVEERARVLS